jgi:pimeloyl-ACP methyl ester carboxylesterase
VAAVTFVLVHGPPVGPFVWSRVAEELRARGEEVVVPHVRDDGSPPFWSQHADCVARAVPAGDVPVVVAGYSAAGPIMPAIGVALARPVAAYVFVDALLPSADGSSRLETSPWPDQLLSIIEAGGVFPDWTEEDLAEALPDAELRRAVFAEVQRRGADYLTEPIPVPATWPDGRCAMLLFSENYAADAEKARGLGWRVIDLGGGHFQLLLEPVLVADALLELAHG